MLALDNLEAFAQQQLVQLLGAVLRLCQYGRRGVIAAQNFADHIGTGADQALMGLIGHAVLERGDALIEGFVAGLSHKAVCLLQNYYICTLLHGCKDRLNSQGQQEIYMRKPCRELGNRCYANPTVMDDGAD